MLTNLEKDELEKLTEKFEGFDFYIIDNTSGSISGRTLHEELVKEDEYEKGKIDDFSAIRLHRLGTLQEFCRYEELMKKCCR